MRTDPALAQTVSTMLKSIERRVIGQERAVFQTPSATVWVPTAPYVGDGYLSTESSSFVSVANCLTFPGSQYLHIRVECSAVFGSFNTLSWQFRGWLASDPTDITVLTNGASAGIFTFDRRLDIGALLGERVLGKLVGIDLQLKRNDGSGPAAIKFVGVKRPGFRRGSVVCVYACSAKTV